MIDGPRGGRDGIVPFFLAQGEQTGPDVARRLASFIGGARRTLDIATYDFRLSNDLKAIVAAALAERAAAGVAIRIVYDADKPSNPNLHAGMDPAPGGTGAFVQSLGLPWRRIGGLKLMHDKYLIRDAATPEARVWTGSTNLTDDAWTLQENNVLEILSPELAAAYTHDFGEMWQSGTFEGTGAFDPGPVTLSYGGRPATVRLLFSPGRGPAINRAVAERARAARRRVRLCNMLLNSGALLSALLDLLQAGRVAVDGIYDRTQMESVLVQWQQVPHNRWKIGAVRDIVDLAHLAGKDSTPYSPTSKHDFMHNKVLVIDDTVVTGSFNFSHSAEQNAENILLIESAPLADAYSAYIDHLLTKYRASTLL